MSYLTRTLKHLLCRPGTRAQLLAIRVQLNRMENVMAEQSAQTTALNEGLAELGTAITDLSTRIDQLPVDVNDVTQEQVDSLREVIGRVKGLAVNAPEVPTPDLPAEPAVPVEGTPSEPTDF